MTGVGIAGPNLPARKVYLDPTGFVGVAVTLLVIGFMANCTLDQSKVYQAQNIGGGHQPMTMRLAATLCAVTNKIRVEHGAAYRLLDRWSCGTLDISTDNFSSSATSSLLTVATMARPPLIPPGPKNAPCHHNSTARTSSGR